jgi:hypothetical protein
MSTTRTLLDFYNAGPNGRQDLAEMLSLGNGFTVRRSVGTEWYTWEPDLQTVVEWREGSRGKGKGGLIKNTVSREDGRPPSAASYLYSAIQNVKEHVLLMESTDTTDQEAVKNCLGFWIIEPFGEGAESTLPVIRLRPLEAELQVVTF